MTTKPKRKPKTESRPETLDDLVADMANAVHVAWMTLGTMVLEGAEEPTIPQDRTFRLAGIDGHHAVKRELGRAGTTFPIYLRTRSDADIAAREEEAAQLRNEADRVAARNRPKIEKLQAENVEADRKAAVVEADVERMRTAREQLRTETMLPEHVKREADLARREALRPLQREMWEELNPRLNVIDGALKSTTPEQVKNHADSHKGEWPELRVVHTHAYGWMRQDRHRILDQSSPGRLAWDRYVEERRAERPAVVERIEQLRAEIRRIDQDLADEHLDFWRQLFDGLGARDRVAAEADAA